MNLSDPMTRLLWQDKFIGEAPVRLLVFPHTGATDISCSALGFVIPFAHLFVSAIHQFTLLEVVEVAVVAVASRVRTVAVTTRPNRSLTNPINRYHRVTSAIGVARGVCSVLLLLDFRFRLGCSFQGFNISYDVIFWSNPNPLSPFFTCHSSPHFQVTGFKPAQPTKTRNLITVRGSSERQVFLEASSRSSRPPLGPKEPQEVS